MSGHGIIECADCGRVLRQCRCSGPHGPITKAKGPCFYCKPGRVPVPPAVVSSESVDTANLAALTAERDALRGLVKESTLRHEMTHKETAND